MEELFSEFKPVTAEQWKERITRDLKGEPFENLVWKNENGFDVLPFYTSEHTAANPPAFSHTSWDICASTRESTASGINRDLLYQLEKGASAIIVGSGRHNYENLLRGIQLGLISSTFFCTGENLEALSKYLDKNYNAADLKLFLFPSSQKSVQETETWVRSVSGLRMPSFHAAGVDALQWFHGGALPYYELALTFSLLAEVVEAEDRTNSTHAGAPVIRTGIDTDLFTMIAKLRAYRRLWELFKPELGRKGELHIIAETSLANKSLGDQHTNLLRTSVEAFGAVAGGANQLVVHSFDALTGKTTKTGMRLALNQQHILKEEAYMDKMADVGNGSYYIEQLTDKLAARALDAFKGIMKNGGYFNLLENGALQKEISAHYSLKEEKIKNGDQVLVGVNKFRNEKERVEAGNISDLLKEGSIRNPGVNWELQQSLNKA